MNVIGLSEYHEGNLRKLAAYLLNLPAAAPRFDMREFADRKYYSREVTHCGTVGCAIGHASLIIDKRLGESWYDFSERVFGLDPAPGREEWDWCFGPQWARWDNSPAGAALRILWLLDRGIPSDARSQWSGRAPLCYANWNPTPPVEPAILSQPYSADGAVQFKLGGKRVRIAGGAK
jgi:hypothetical protein